MYAHQVIEDIERLGFTKIHPKIEKLEHALYLKNLFSEVSSQIRQSQKFHGPEAFLLVDEISKVVGCKLFLEKSEFLHLPYSVCWVDFDSTHKGELSENRPIRSTKRGVLVVDKSSDKGSRLWACYPFAYLADIKMWAPSAMHYWISVGRCFSGSDTNIRVALSMPHFGDDPNYKTDLENISNDDVSELTYLHGFLMLLNCKNIAAEEVHPPSKLNKKRLRSNKLPLFSYKTLSVNPGAGSSRGGKNGIPLNHNRIHLCRGHFKHYSEDAPLFGRITGLWWWQPHVRGQNRKGVVMKDYIVEQKAA